MNELLKNHPRARTSDVEEFRETVSGLLRPHRLDPHPRRNGELMVFNSVDLGGIALCYKTYGASVRVRHEPLDSFLLVYFSLAGSLTVRGNGSETHHNREAAAIIDPDADYDTSVGAGAEGLMLRVERSAIQAELHRMLGRPPARRLRFQPSLDMATPRALSCLSMLGAICADLDGPRGVSHPALRRPVQRLIIAQLLTTLNHSASEELAGTASTPTNDASPRVIRRADQVIRDHCREDLTVSDIAEAVGVSIRSLQNGFRKHLNTTPTERMRQARLAGARSDLLASEPTRTTVSRVAADWGFRHFGRFSRSYQQTFGETPSESLRR